MSLLDYLPESYQNSPETVDLLEAIGQQTDTLYARYLDFLNQHQVCTATWGLSFWEQIYGIPADVSKPEQERREILYSKMRAIGSVTPEMIRRLAAAFSEGEPVVTECPSEYRFTVFVTQSLDRPTYLHGLYAAIEEMKPAHLQAGYGTHYLPVSLQETESVFLRNFGVKASFWNGFGSDSIRFNGSRRFDGSFLFDQTFKRVKFYHFKVSGRMENHSSLSGTWTRNYPFFFDNQFLFDGTQTFSGGITKGDL